MPLSKTPINMGPHGCSFRVAPWTCRRKTRRPFALSNPALAGLEPQRSAPQGPLYLQPGKSSSAAPA